MRQRAPASGVPLLPRCPETGGPSIAMARDVRYTSGAGWLLVSHATDQTGSQDSQKRSRQSSRQSASVAVVGVSYWGLTLTLLLMTILDGGRKDQSFANKTNSYMFPFWGRSG